MDSCLEKSRADDACGGGVGGCATGSGQEQALLQALAGGNADAFWDLWAIHRDHLYSVCARAMGGNHAEAEDALGQVMLKARQEMAARAGKIDVPRAWLTRLANNLCIDIRRDFARQAKAAKQLEEWAENAGWSAATGGESSDAALMQEESEAEIRRRVDRLPPELRKPFTLKFFHEQSCATIAAQLGLSPAGVRKRLQLASALLRRNWNRSAAQEESAVPPAALPVNSKPVQAKWEIAAPTAMARLAPVRLPCGVERYFQIFLACKPGRERQKIRALRGYLRRHPGSRKGLWELAQLLYQTGAWAEAIQISRQALEKKPFWLSGALLLGEMLFLTGNRDEAGAVYGQALSQASQPASQRHISGLVAGCRGDWKEAATCFKEAATQELENPVHLHALAWAQMQAGRPDAALRALDEALRLNSNDLVALSSGQAALQAVGQSGESWPQVKRALTAATDETLALARLADHYRQTASARLENIGQDRLLLRLALRQAPQSPTALAALAAHHFSRGDRERGLALMQKLRERYPGCSRIDKQYQSLLTLAGTKPPAEAAVREGARPCAGTCWLAGIRAGL